MGLFQTDEELKREQLGLCRRAGQGAHPNSLCARHLGVLHGGSGGGWRCHLSRHSVRSQVTIQPGPGSRVMCGDSTRHSPGVEGWTSEQTRSEAPRRTRSGVSSLHLRSPTRGHLSQDLQDYPERQNPQGSELFGSQKGRQRLGADSP